MFLDKAKKAEIKIYMDGRGWYLNTIFIERLVCTLKKEADCLHAIFTGFQAKRISDDSMDFENVERPHTAGDRRTPDTA